MAGTVRKSSVKGLRWLKKAMENGQNPLSAAEVDFVQTSCWILGIDSAEMIEMIGRKAMDRGKGQVRKVMTAITSQLDELGARVQAHKRLAPTPAMSTRTYDNMDAPGLRKGSEGCNGGGILERDQGGQDGLGECPGGFSNDCEEDGGGGQMETKRV